MIVETAEKKPDHMNKLYFESFNTEVSGLVKTKPDQQQKFC